jgi:uncharacterized membrane protein YedE/YeeE
MPKPKAYINPYLAGFALGLVLFLSFYLTGNGLGASGGLNRAVVAVQDVVVPHHVDNTPYLCEMAGGSKAALSSWLMPLLAGTLLGGLASGFWGGRLKIETHKGAGISNKKRWLLALIGGAIMGYGSRFARGCTSGHALSGGATLSAGAWAFMFAIFAGAYLFAWFVRKNWKPEV